TVAVALSVSGFGLQASQDLIEAVTGVDEDEEAERRQVLQGQEVRRVHGGAKAHGVGGRGSGRASCPGTGGKQHRTGDARQARRGLGGELGDRLGGADHMRMGEALLMQLSGSRSRAVEDEPGVDESRGEEITGQVDRVRVEGLGRFIGSDERDLAVRAPERRRERVDTAVYISTKVHSHSRQATPSPATPVSVPSGIVSGCEALGSARYARTVL